MTKEFGPTLFLIASPFQALCMLEALGHFHITDYDVIIPYCDELSNDSIELLLKQLDISYQKIKVAHIIKDVLPFFCHKHKYYQNAFIGDFYSLNSFAIAVILGKRGCNLYYLDDGTQVLDIVSDNPQRRCKNWKISIVFSLYKFLSIIKCVKKESFFTIYPVKTSKFRIIKNEFCFFKNKQLQINSGVFIIGTVSSSLDFLNHTYKDFLYALGDYIPREFPGQRIFYCPHRRDLNNDENFRICNNLGFEIFQTTVSVEYDFIRNGVNPICVIGFTSNALYTLHLLYPKTKVKTIFYRHSSIKKDNMIRHIREQLVNNGIESLALLD